MITPLTYTLTASASGFCEGATDGVRFALQGTQKGMEYQLYRDATPAGTILTGTGSAATFSGTFNTAGTYTARTVAGDLYSEVVMDNPRVITAYPLPTTTSLTAAPAAICKGQSSTLTALPNGAASYSFDDGGSWQATAILNVTPASNMTYTLKVRSAENCVSSDSKTAMITVTNCMTTPPFAASTQTWKFDSSTLTWSDWINADLSRTCPLVTTFSTANNTVKQHAIYNGHTFYSYSCVQESAETLCPSSAGWRVPYKSDFDELKSKVSVSTLVAQWGVTGQFVTAFQNSENAYLWSQTTTATDKAYAYDYPQGNGMFWNNYFRYGYTIRCVR
jgi:hypothetical protein